MIKKNVCARSWSNRKYVKLIFWSTRMYPLCRTQWKQVPLFVDVPVRTFPAQTLLFGDDEPLPLGETQIHIDDDQHQALEINLFPQVSAVAKPITRGEFCCTCPS
ncbi:hypothetical protein Bca4012_026135 [Brassica carinata]|uniref:Uncharacterized protein n=1 Tax=Brassica carinata TaxID=52824 RepID=A0A8X8AUA9_BRACI|nr:hypothetical protein Bca52824_023235 [Brassica carinata]